MGSKGIWLIIVAMFSIGIILSGYLIFASGPSRESPADRRAEIAMPASSGDCC